MQKLLRIIWGIILILSVAWMVVGFVAAAQIVPADSVITDLTSKVETIAMTVGADQIEGYSLPAFFLASGLPLFVVAAFFLWRINRLPQPQSAGNDVETFSKIPLPFPENTRKSKQKDNSALRRRTLGISALAFVAVFFLWNNADMEMLLYPLRLFVTFVHEAGHSLAALLSGGQVQGFRVFANGSGVATTLGGNPALILPAGYLGAALFGSLLFLLSNRAPRSLSGMSIMLGAFMIGLTAVYARPDESGSPIAMIVGIGFGMIILLLGAKAPLVVNQFVLNTLAIMTALEAVLDLLYLVGHAGISRGEQRNDALAFAQQITPLLTASIVALIWAAIAVAILVAAIYFGAVKPLRQEIVNVVSGSES